MSLFYENDHDDMYDYIPGAYVHGDDIYTPDEYMEEKWWYIDEVPGYMISNCGRVWSEKSRCFVKPKPMDRKGHMGVCLSVNGKRRYFYLHRLMGNVFIPNPDKYPIVRHLNDIPYDNEIDNLAWGTQRDNVMDAKRNGRTFTADPEIREKVADSQRSPIWAVNLSTGEKKYFKGQGVASRILNIAQANIWKVLNGQRKQAGGYYFEYVERGY